VSTLDALLPARRAPELASVAGWVVLLAALAISIGPFLYLISVSLMSNQQIFNGTVIAWPWRLENYPEAWVVTRIGTLYWNSIYISTVSMVLTVAISALAGYGLGRLEFPGKPYVFALILIGLTIPLQIALIPLFVNLRTLGLMNTPLALIGPYTAFGLAFGTYIMKGFFEELPRELEEAARIDGASDFRIFWQIMLPLTRPALATIAIFLFLQNWNEFLFALTFVTENSMRTLPTGIYALISSEFYGNYGLLAAALVLFSLPVLVLYFIFQQQFIEGLTAGALKH
jgi:raffinose/stachyose/melibiose transport system permease protein